MHFVAVSIVYFRLFNLLTNIYNFTYPMKELGEIKRTADYLDYTDKYIEELFHQYLPDDPLWVYKYAYSLRRAAQMMRNHTDLNTLADAYESLSVSFADKASPYSMNDRTPLRIIEILCKYFLRCFKVKTFSWSVV